MCEKGSLCKYVHDKDMIRICPLFLAGKCYGRDCLLSHTPNDCNTPVCRYYLDRTCTNSNCKYRHFKPDHYDDPNYEILTCRPFAITGYCARGKKCPFYIYRVVLILKKTTTVDMVENAPYLIDSH